MRDPVWSNLCDTQFKVYYLSFLENKYHNYERYLNIFLAVFSSGSVAAWAIWNVVPMLWAGIVAISHIISLSRPYLPFSKYAKIVNDKLVIYQPLVIEFERLWHRIQRDKINEDEAEELFFELRKRQIEAESKGDEMAFSDDKKLEDKANQRMDIYLRTYHCVTPNYH